MWESWELPAIPTPSPQASIPGDYSGDPQLATARFSFVLLAVGALAGVIALQSWMQLDKDPLVQQGQTKGDVFASKWEGAIMVPIAAFGLGFGLPIYVYSRVLAERDLEDAQRKKLSGR